MNFQTDTMSCPMHKIPAIFFPENAPRAMINIGGGNICFNHGQSPIMSIFNYLISIFLPVCQFPKSNGTSFIGTISFVLNAKINNNKISFFYFSVSRSGMGKRGIFSRGDNRFKSESIGAGFSRIVFQLQGHFFFRAAGFDLMNKRKNSG